MPVVRSVLRQVHATVERGVPTCYNCDAESLGPFQVQAEWEASGKTSRRLRFFLFTGEDSVMVKHRGFVVTVCIALGTIYAGSARAALTDGLVGYWPLDGLEATDAGPNGLDGVINGNVDAVEDRFGVADGAMLFPGEAGSHVDLGDNELFQISGAMTLAAWVVLDSTNTNNGRIVAKQGLGGSRSWSLNIESGGSPATFHIAADGGTVVAVNDPDELPMDEWVHMVGVYRPGESVEIYVNGELKELNDVDIPAEQFSDNGLPVLIGARNACGNCGWLGAIDDVAIWDRDLSLEEIGTLFQSGIGGGAVLFAGDADMDLDFDQLDLVRVQIAAKYLNGASATWGEGDWNGAPGGQPGSPPPGNGLFDQLDIIAALAPGHYLKGPYAALLPNGQAADGQTSVGYNASTGELWVDAPAGRQLTSINIDSAAGIFTGDAAQNLGGSFDNDADNNIFKATFGSSFGSLSFGNVARAGLSKDFLLGDLTVVGSLAGGGNLGAVDLVYVPEPTTLALFVMGLLGAIGKMTLGASLFGRDVTRTVTT
jgi:hypothetical protein